MKKASSFIISIILTSITSSAAYSNNIESIELFCAGNESKDFKVIAKNALNVRQEPTAKSAKLSVLNEAQIVKISNKCGDKEIVSDKYGRWLNLVEGGYIFSAFVQLNNSEASQSDVKIAATFKGIRDLIEAKNTLLTKKDSLQEENISDNAVRIQNIRNRITYIDKEIMTLLKP